jgi:nucleoside-diphosphate-sugar epimerase
MRVLVTGFNGFIGMRLVPYLDGRLRDVVPFYGDVANPDDWEGNEECHPDAVIHLAAMTGLAECEADRKKAYATNVGSVIIAKDVIPYAKHILASTVTVMGTGHGDRYRMYNEDVDVRPLTAYDATKAMAEDAMPDSGVVLRMSNVYGVSPSASSPERGIVNAFVYNAAFGITNTVYAEVAQCVRDYIYILDVVRAFYLALDYDVVGTYNVCSGVGHTVEEMAALCGEYKVVRSLRNLLPIETRCFVGDNSRLRSFGWEPMVSLENGIELTRRVYQ